MMFSMLLPHVANLEAPSAEDSRVGRGGSSNPGLAGDMDMAGMTAVAGTGAGAGAWSRAWDPIVAVVADADADADAVTVCGGFADGGKGRYSRKSGRWESKKSKGVHTVVRTLEPR